MELLDRLTTASSFSGRDMNHAVEMYTVDEVKGSIQQFTPVNNEYVKNRKHQQSGTTLRHHNKQHKMLVWVTYQRGLSL
jgi:hypothetical protein